MRCFLQDLGAALDRRKKQPVVEEVEEDDLCSLDDGINSECQGADGGMWAASVLVVARGDTSAWATSLRLNMGLTWLLA